MSFGRIGFAREGLGIDVDVSRHRRIGLIAAVSQNKVDLMIHSIAKTYPFTILVRRTQHLDHHVPTTNILIINMTIYPYSRL